jgi:RHS repeat-associated protein
MGFHAIEASPSEVGGARRRAARSSARPVRRLGASHVTSRRVRPDRQLSESGHRFYNPNLGRWVNRDKIEERGGLNMYGFLRNGPKNTIDYIGNLLIDLRPDPVDGCPYSLREGVTCGQTGCGHKDKSGRTIGYREVICTCHCDGDDRRYGWRLICHLYVWCEIELDPNFRRQRTVLCGGDWRREIPSEDATRSRVYGHEQRHAKAWIKAVKDYVVPILQQQDEGTRTSENTCKMRAESAMSSARWALDDILARKHSNDSSTTQPPYPLQDAPDSALLYDPLGAMPPRAMNE